MYFSDPQIVFQEVPDEISLALSISGCPLRCDGCHSSYTWDPTYGKELTNEDLFYLLHKHKHISCVLFYGGDWEKERLIELLEIVKYFGLKTALYSGYDVIDKELVPYLDYYKIGRYNKHLGALISPVTNQRMYRIVHSKNGDALEDITHVFRRKVGDF